MTFSNFMLQRDIVSIVTMCQKQSIHQTHMLIRIPSNSYLWCLEIHSKFNSLSLFTYDRRWHPLNDHGKEKRIWDLSLYTVTISWDRMKICRCECPDIPVTMRHLWFREKLPCNSRFLHVGVNRDSIHKKCVPNTGPLFLYSSGI